MEDKNLEQQYREYLETLSLTTLRQLGREKGVVPTIRTGNKPELIEGIVDILIGRTQPVPSSGRGAPVKLNFLDPTVLPRLEEIRRKATETETRQPAFEKSIGVASSGEEEGKQTICSGILEIMQNGYGFLRARNCQPTNGEDVFIPATLIHSLKLREGDFVTCSVKPRVKNDSAAIEELLSVNGLGRGRYEQRDFFDSLTASYPSEKIGLSEKRQSLSLRLLDMFVPIGKGQRALIIAPPKAGKTTLLKDIARSISDNHREVQLIVLLIDERPEEVTDFRSSVKGGSHLFDV